MKKLMRSLEENPIIAAVKSADQLERAIKGDNEVIFLLNGSIFNMKQEIEQIKKKGKVCFIHFDLIDGLGKNITALEYLHKEFQPDGIISTKPNIILMAKKMGLITIQRHFIIDSMSLKNTIDIVKDTKPDAVEILPGVIDTVIEQIKSETNIPIIAGGLISKKEHIIQCIKAGVIGISSTNESVWNM